MLDPLELVHLNGRVYDPLVGKFLSGDPYVKDTFNGQNYNRYSYVLNNPTTLLNLALDSASISVDYPSIRHAQT